MLAPLPPTFAYDRSQPLFLADRGPVTRDYPIPIHDVSFASGPDRVDAYLVRPRGIGRLPGVVYLHGSGGDRHDLLAQATWLAARGAVALAITAPSAGAQPSRNPAPLAVLRHAHDLAVGDVVAVRRAVDLLRSLARVDPQRIGFVGHSAGARTGAIVAGVEGRVDALVLMSGGASPLSAYAAHAPPELRDDVRRLLGPLDPLRLIARAAPATLLLQAGRRDKVVPQDALRRLAAAAPEGTDVRWYDAGHALDDSAYLEQLDWLARKLAIDGPVVAGVATGP